MFKTLLKQLCQPKQRLFIDANGSLAVKKISFYESLFGLKHQEKKQIATQLMKDKEALFTSFKSLYYSHSPEEKASALKLHKKIKAMTSDEHHQALHFQRILTSQWMTHLPNDRKAQTIDNILKPGTHDSGAYHLSGKVPKGIIGFWKRLFFKLSTWPIIGTILKWLTLTQKVDIKEQLYQGIRSFDFRLALGDDEQLYLAHTLLCEKLEDELKKINDFLDTYPNEVIFIDLKIDKSHLKNLNHHEVLTSGDHNEKIQQLFQGVFSSKIVPYTPELPVFNELIRTNQRVFLCTRPGQDLGNQFQWKSHQFWPNQTKQKKVVPQIQTLLASKCIQVDFHNVSFNTTADKKEATSRVLTGKSLLKEGQQVQQRHAPTLFDTIAAHHLKQPWRISAIVVDNFTDKFIQDAIVTNHP